MGFPRPLQSIQSCIDPSGTLIASEEVVDVGPGEPARRRAQGIDDSIRNVLDREHLIHPDHLHAALAIWEYNEASTTYIFGDRLGA